MGRSTFSIHAYRKATAPLRSLMLSRYRAQKKVPISGLFYHRVADWQPTPWTVSQATFKQHIDWLQDNLQLISMDEAIRRIETGVNTEPAAVITFDDGYADNMDFAIPLLVERKIPCTYFITTYQVINQLPFQHDLAFPLRLYPNSIRDIKKMVRWGIDIGAHTCNHTDLATVVDKEKLRTELKGCRRQIMNLFGCPVNHFAFPYGQRKNISAAAIGIAREAGFKSVSAAYGGYNFMGQESFVFQRFHGDPKLERIQNWMTLDPRFINVRPNPEWLHSPEVGGPSLEVPGSYGTASYHSSFPIF